MATSSASLAMLSPGSASWRSGRLSRFFTVAGLFAANARIDRPRLCHRLLRDAGRAGGVAFGRALVNATGTDHADAGNWRERPGGGAESDELAPVLQRRREYRA